MHVLLVPNLRNPRSLEATRMVAGYLTANGYAPLLAEDDAREAGLSEFGVARSDIGSPELAVALGGDGTILKAVHLLGVSEVPVLGINLGRLGFLSGAGGEALQDAVTTALAGEARVERRQTIEVSVRAGGRQAGTYRALNEVFVGRGGGARGVEVEIAVNERVIGRHLCDGFIVATPTGSTAYALSAGGPLVAPDVRGLVLVSVAPHTLATRPMVLGPAERVRISCPNPARADACVAIDGDTVPCRTSLDSVDVWMSDHDVRLLRLDGRDFYGVVAQTFFGA